MAHNLQNILGLQKAIRLKLLQPAFKANCSSIKQPRLGKIKKYIVKRLIAQISKIIYDFVD